MRLQMVLIRYIIRMRDGRSRILKNGGAQSARQQRKRYRKPESHQKKSPEWELTRQSWSAIAIDQEGKVLTNTPIWMDTRAQSICDRLNQEIGADEIFKISGNPFSHLILQQRSSGTGKISRRFIKKYTRSFSRTATLHFKLTDAITQDVSQGYGLHCFDMKKGCWDEEMCEQLGIPMGFLPEICDCDHVVGTVTAKAAAECGLAEGTPVVAGGLDAACGTLGAGVIHTGETQEQGGQAGGMSICTDEYKADPRLILSYHVVPGKWLLQGGTTGGGWSHALV